MVPEPRTRFPTSRAPRAGLAGSRVRFALGLPYALWRAWKGGERRYGLGLAWMLAALLGAAMGGHYYPHYFQIALAPLALVFFPGLF